VLSLGNIFYGSVQREEKLIRTAGWSGWTGFERYSMETVAARTVPRDQSAARWRTGPAGYSDLGMQMTVAFAGTGQSYAQTRLALS